MLLAPSNACASSPGLRVAVRAEAYAVAGSTAAHLREAVALLGPRRGGARFAAYTDWTLAWSYAPAAVAGGVGPVSPRIEVAVTCTLPRWRPPRSAAAALVEAWSACLAAAVQHERGHVDLAIAAGCAALDALRAVPPRAGEGALDAAVRACVAGVIEDFRRQEARYDEATGHGEAQGVRLP
jgi:predicted secreted Zn-dependent protease